MSQISTSCGSKCTVQKTSVQLVVVGLPILIYISIADLGLSVQLQRFIPLTVWAVLAWITDILPDTMIGILLPFLYVMFGIASPVVAFNPWYGNVPWITIGGLIIGHMLLETGLANRIAYSTMYAIGGSFRQIMSGLMLAGFILGPLVPSALSKMSIFCVIAIGICQAFNFQPGTRDAAAIMLAAYFSVSIPTLCFLTGSGHIPTAVYIMQQTSGLPITWSQYTMQNLPVCLVYATAMLILICVLFKNDKANYKEIISKRYLALGPMTGKEKRAAIILVVTLILLATDSLHHISPAWILLLSATLLFAPGVSLLRQEDLQKINFLIVFYISGAMSIGSVAADIGAAKMLADQFMPLLYGAAAEATFAASYLFGCLLLFFITPVAGLSTFAGPLSTLAMNLGLDPRPMVYSLTYGMDQALYPYQYTLLLLLFKTGYLTKGHLFRIMFPKILVGLCVLIFVAFPYWALLGLLKR